MWTLNLEPSLKPGHFLAEKLIEMFAYSSMIPGSDDN